MVHLCIAYLCLGLNHHWIKLKPSLKGKGEEKGDVRPYRSIHGGGGAAEPITNLPRTIFWMLSWRRVVNCFYPYFNFLFENQSLMFNYKLYILRNYYFNIKTFLITLSDTRTLYDTKSMFGRVYNFYKSFIFTSGGRFALSTSLRWAVGRRA